MHMRMGAHGGCMPGARRGGGGYGRPQGGGVWAPVGGAWAPSNIFVGRGKPKKAPHNRKKDLPHREKVAERPSHGEKCPHKEKNVAKRAFT